MKIIGNDLVKKTNDRPDAGFADTDASLRLFLSTDGGADIFQAENQAVDQFHKQALGTKKKNGGLEMKTNKRLLSNRLDIQLYPLLFDHLRNQLGQELMSKLYDQLRNQLRGQYSQLYGQLEDELMLYVYRQLKSWK